MINFSKYDLFYFLLRFYIFIYILHFFFTLHFSFKHHHKTMWHCGYFNTLETENSCGYCLSIYRWKLNSISVQDYPNYFQIISFINLILFSLRNISWFYCSTWQFGSYQAQLGSFWPSISLQTQRCLHLLQKQFTTKGSKYLLLKRMPEFWV